MTQARIVLAGAGGHFTSGLMNDIVMCKGLQGSTVVLYDPNIERLNLISRLSKKIVEESTAKVEIESTTKRDVALANADFVMCTIRVGGFEATRSDIEIPKKYGINQTVGDTIGPGGLFYGLRNIWAIIEICRDLERLSPKALVINFTNPMNGICSAIYRHTRIKSVGLCHGIFGTMERLADLFKVDRKRLYGFAAGINHLTWIMDFRLDEKDAYPLLKENLLRLGAVARELFKIFGLFPSPGDAHIAEFFPWYLCKEANYGETYGLTHEFSDVSAMYKEREELERQIIAQVEGKAPIIIRPSGEIAVGIINSITNNERAIYDAVNIQNEGCITNVLAMGNVEVPAMVDGGGIHGLTCGELPFSIASYLNRIIAEQILLADAAVKGDRDLALQSLLMDPHTATVKQATDMFEELLKAHTPYLPQFKK
jgi:alpha-galactosidase